MSEIIAIRFFHRSHNTVHFGGVFALKQWIISSLKHDTLPRVNNLYCLYVKNPPKRVALWDRENSQFRCILRAKNTLLLTPSLLLSLRLSPVLRLLCKLVSRRLSLSSECVCKILIRFLPCIRLERGQFELTIQDSAGGKSSSTSVLM